MTKKCLQFFSSQVDICAKFKALNVFPKYCVYKNETDGGGCHQRERNSFCSQLYEKLLVTMTVNKVLIAVCVNCSHIKPSSSHTPL